jgi:hypothetical protein
VKFQVETINDFQKSIYHNLEILELEMENKALSENCAEVVGLLQKVDYFFRNQALIVSSEFNQENKGSCLTFKIWFKSSFRVIFLRMDMALKNFAIFCIIESR